MVKVGKGLTVIVTVFVPIQPLPFVPETVYVVVTVGLGVIDVVFTPVFHVYVVAPLAVKDIVLPAHTVAEAGVIVMVGKAFTVTATEAVFTQPFEFVPVTV